MTEQQIREAESVLVRLSKPSTGVGAISAYLQRAIETGAYSEGDRLPPERQLAATFKAARSTVRRALDKLEKEGLVSRRLGSGTFVGSTLAAGKRASDLVDELSPLQLVEARLAVEPFTARLAVLHATRRILDEMEGVLAHAETATRDKDEFSKWDGEFHLLLARASANPLLLFIYRQINHVRLHAQWDAMKEKILTPDVIAEYNRQHRGIFNAIQVRDAQLAQQLITEHLEKAREDLVKAASP
ncbi:MAG: FadR/GntR family transcriptional regulator [Hyphomicrobiales bacterium]